MSEISTHPFLIALQSDASLRDLYQRAPKENWVKLYIQSICDNPFDFLKVLCLPVRNSLPAKCKIDRKLIGYLIAFLA